MAKDPAERLSELKSRVAQMGQQSHYAFLEVAPDASSEQILAAYRGFAKNFHVDTFARLSLTADDRKAIDAFFARLNDARTALQDAAKRQAYDASLVSPPPEEVNQDDLSALFEADSAFRKGTALLASGAFVAARERFTLALRGNPDDLETQAHLAFVTFMAEPMQPNNHRTPEALAALKTLSELAKAYPDHINIQFFYGKLLLLSGDEAAAIKAFEHIISLNERHADTQRELRLIRMRHTNAHAQPKSLLGRLKNLFKR